MDLPEILVDGLYFHFYDRKVRSRISKKGDSFFIYDFEFSFKVNNSHLEVSVSLPNEVDSNTFKKHLEKIQSADFWEKFPSIKKSREEYHQYLVNKELSFRGRKCSFKANINTEDTEKAVDSVLYYVIKPILLFTE
jgi:hypothetical protein